ncbi:hypothetical protein Syun_025716 [Stephania yunnanensis]|uniref:ACT domain-containing protein ACR n=1 Tax=Stephania yunnanensis TaxID=152371 RepID=A0AAP0HW11_9MAGN
MQVDSVNKQGLLLQVVQALTDMNLTISKGYISSDAGWFMDVFHVKDEHGNKLTDQRVIDYIQQEIGMCKATDVCAYVKNMQVINAKREIQDSGEVRPLKGKDVEAEISKEQTTIELAGTDRPGLFSEISAALADLRCNVIEAHAWSHNERLACVACISDQSTASSIDDPRRLASIKDHLTTVINATTCSDATGTNSDQNGVGTTGLPGGDGNITNIERRLHQLMVEVQDFKEPTRSMSSSAFHTSGDTKEEGRKSIVSIENCSAKGYSMVSIECKDRQRLMFDTVCTLTDMQYTIFHASISCHGDNACQEYYIRHIEGRTLNTEDEKQRVTKCLEAAIERRACEGVRLELRAHNRLGLLSDITRLLREYGLVVVRADVATQGEKSTNAFYVRDMSGNEVDIETVESMKKEMEQFSLEVRDEFPRVSSPVRARFSIGNMLKSQIERLSHNFIPIK